MAVAYRSLPVFLWDLETITLLGTCVRPTIRHGSVLIPITDFVFNPNLEAELLAVVYMAIQLIIYDTLRRTFEASTH